MSEHDIERQEARLVPAAPLTLWAPVRVVDPLSGRVLLEVACVKGDAVLRLYNGRDKATVELFSGDEAAGGGGLILNNHRGEKGASIYSDHHGGAVIVQDTREFAGEGLAASLYCDNETAMMSLTTRDGRSTEVKVGGGK